VTGGRSGLPVGDLLSDGPVTRDLSVPASALAIGAHPDDIEFGGGATLARWAAAGCRVHHLVLTDGSKGTWDPGADLARLIVDRKEECRAAAAVLDGGAPSAWAEGAEGAGGAEGDRVLFLDRVDGELDNGRDERREVARIIRTVRPAVLLGHDPWRRYRLHPDHRTAGFLMLDALVAARDPHFFTDLDLDPHRPDALLLWEADLPNHAETAGTFAPVKVEALLCHRSQFESTMGLPPTSGPDAGRPVDVDDRGRFAAKVDRQLEDHGALDGGAPAEAFRLLTDL
jgi:LmbE family N-acetylglucosaminyl deacetylase